MKSLFSCLVLLAVMSSGLYLAFRISPVAAQDTIHIRADGSIDPSTAPIFTEDNVTYTLTGTVTSNADAIILERDDITLDGEYYTVQGPGLMIASVGIELTGSNITVANATVRGFRYGVLVRFGYGNNTIEANKITGNNWGIELVGYSSDNSITANNITASYDYGIGVFESSNYNSISENYVANNGRGLLFSDSANNTIFHNSIVNNTKQVQFFEPSSANTWDNGYLSGGNYWSDYNGTDANHDGIGDTPYVIDANNTDNYPLMTPFTISEFSATLIVALLVASSSLAVVVFGKKRS